MTEHVRTIRRRTGAAFLLGLVALTRPGCTNPSQPLADDESDELPADVWGGDHIRIEIGDTIALVEFDCAHGGIAVPIRADRTGKFVAAGTFTQEHGGPIHEDALPKMPAQYKGQIVGDHMTVTVAASDGSRTLGPFELERGRSGRVYKCL